MTGAAKRTLPAPCPICQRVGGCSHDPKYQAYLALVAEARVREQRLREVEG